jgi:hypothetical protein
MPDILEENKTRLRDDAFLYEKKERQFGETHRKVKLYVREPRLDKDLKIGYNTCTINPTRPVSDAFYQPIPWETVLEGRTFEGEDVRPIETDVHNADLPIEEKAKLRLLIAESEGFGGQWDRAKVKKSFADFD